MDTRQIAETVIGWGSGLMLLGFVAGALMEDIRLHLRMDKQQKAIDESACPEALQQP